MRGRRCGDPAPRSAGRAGGAGGRARGGGTSAPWPQRPITLIVPYPPGGSTDNVSRPIQQPLSTLLGQGVLIENRGGAGGSIGAAAVAQARPDGYTLLVFPTAVLTISPHMMRLPDDPARDFTLIALLGISDGAVAMHPSVPVRTIHELVAYARANPGRLRFSSAGNGTITQMTGEIFGEQRRHQARSTSPTAAPPRR